METGGRRKAAKKGQGKGQGREPAILEEKGPDLENSGGSGDFFSRVKNYRILC